ncbi:MAG: ABC transporter permease [Bacteroidales bacterium]
MLKNYLLVAIRNIFRSKASSLINIVGLGLGIGVFILIFLFISQEYKVDNFIKEKEKIYRLEFGEWALLGPGFANFAEMHCPDVDEAVSVTSYFIDDEVITQQDRVFRVDGYMPVTNNFISFFDFEILQGRVLNPLDDKYDIVLTESEAKRLFGNENPIGKIITVYDEHNFTVTAVIEDPTFFHLPFKALFSFDILQVFYGWDEIESKLFNNMNNPTYLKLVSPDSKNVVAERLNLKLEELMGSKPPFELRLRPVSDIYFNGALSFEGKVKHGNPRFIGVMIVVAILILILACVNYINLSTARASTRAKEIAIRKAIGGSRFSIISQFLGESVLTALFAMLIGVALAELLASFFGSLVERDLSSAALITPLSIFYLFISAIIIGIISGLYPSFYLSSFSTNAVLKGNLVKGAKSGFLRKLLIGFQFFVSVALIISTLVIFSQLNYFTRFDVGFDKEQIVNLRIPRKTSYGFDVFKDKVMQTPGVKGVTRSNAKMGSIKWQESYKDMQGNMHNYSYHPVDPDYIDVLGLEIIQGRSFEWDRPADKNYAVVINETLADMLETENPIGEKLEGGWSTREIIGVVKDFNFNSLHSNIGPLVLCYRGSAYNTYNIKINVSQLHETLDNLRIIWNDYAIEEPFEYTFLNDSFERLYRSEMRMGQMFGYFAVIAIFIGCMGLFGLSDFMVQARVKEMGIRKVMGASSLRIMGLLWKEFALLVMAANVIAWPAAYFAMNTWLQDFPYRTSISILYFIAAFILSMLIAFLTVSYHTWRTARANPVDALKYE